VPADQPTIQQAIDAAANGDTVLVAPGTYNGNINFNGKVITVMSSGGAAVTTIAGDGGDSVVKFISAEGSTSVLEGFTVTGGFSRANGGGILVSNSSPTIRNNTITRNVATSGLGIAVQSGSPLIQRNTISDNSQFGSGGSGGGIFVGGDSTAKITGNTITRNALPNGGDGGGIALAAGSATVSANLITGNSVFNRGGGIAIFNFSTATIVNNVIADNSANDQTSEGVYIAASGSGPFFTNNTVINSTHFSASNTDVQNNIIFTSSSKPAITCGTVAAPTLIDNILFSIDGTPNGGLCVDVVGTKGNVAENPLFVNPARGDYHFADGSRAWNSGNSTALGLPSTDFAGGPRILGPAIDRGAFEEATPPVLAKLSISPARFTFADQPVSTSGPDQEFV
jgi:parallel beta-helix repeat protein